MFVFKYIYICIYGIYKYSYRDMIYRYIYYEYIYVNYINYSKDRSSI